MKAIIEFKERNKINNYLRIHNNKVIFCCIKISYLHWENCLLWISWRVFKFGIFFSEIRSSSKFSKTQGHYSKTLQEGQGPKVVQGSSTHKIFCSQVGDTHGLQYIRDLNSRQSETIWLAKLGLDLSEDLEFYLCSNPIMSIKFLYKSGLKRKLQFLARAFLLIQPISACFGL